MDFITFRCSSCNQGLKVPADRAGRRVKCTKCGTPLTVPAASPASPAPKAKFAKPGAEMDEEEGGGTYAVQGYDPQAAAAPPPPPPPSRFRDDEDEEPDEEDYDPEYVAEQDEELRRRLQGLDEEGEPEEDEEEAEVDEEGRPRKARRRGKAKLPPDAMQKVRAGLIVVMAAVGILAVAVLLREIVVVIGLPAGNVYAQTVVEVVDKQQPNFELPRAVIAMITGLSGLDAGLILVRIGQVLMVLFALVMIVGCVICLAIPGDRYGTRGLLAATIALTAVNLILGIVFRLLPLVGAMNWCLVPLLGPELAMLAANEGRLEPIQLTWGTSPYVQVLLTVFILLTEYVALVMFPLFMRAVARLVKSDKLEGFALSLVQLGLAQVFMQGSYQLLAMTGSSDVLGWVLKFVYCVALGFFILQLVWYVLLLIALRGRIERTLQDQENW